MKQNKMSKNLIVSLLIVMLIPFAASAADVTSISIMPNHTTVSPGGTFTVDVIVTPGPNAVYAGQYDLNFNPARLQATLQNPGTFLKQDNANTMIMDNTIDNVLGKASYAETRFGVPNGVTNPGILASVTFKVSDQAQPGEIIPLGLANIILSNSDAEPIINIEVVNGDAIIPEAPPAPTVTITQPTEGQVLNTNTVVVKYEKSGDQTNVDHAALKLDSGLEVQDTDNDGTFTFNSVPEGVHTVEVWLVDAGNNHIEGAYDNVGFSIDVPNNARIEVVIPEDVEFQGGEFTASIYVDSQGAEVFATQYTLLFDNTLLEAISQTPGDYLKQDGAETMVPVNKIFNALGQTQYGETRMGVRNGITTPGILANVTFRVKQINADTVTELNLKDVLLSDPFANPVPNVGVIGDSIKLVLNNPPTAEFTYDGTDMLYGLDVMENINFDASSSIDTDGTIVSYAWNFGDSTTGTGVAATHAYSHSGIYVVSLTVTDDDGATNTIQKPVVVELVGDVNRDHVVNIQDIVLIVLNWLEIE